MLYKAKKGLHVIAQMANVNFFLLALAVINSVN